jgi:hypothetical protein
MKKLIAICAVLLIVIAANVNANTIASSTMVFEGSLTEISGVFTGTINMTAGNYYVEGGGGASISTGGGFDIYAKEGGTAYVSCYTPTSVVIGPDHDAYNESGAWGEWYDPDCSDWNMFTLELTQDHWYLHYANAETPTPTPMSGTMNWLTGLAAETDLGTQNGGHDGSDIHGGGTGAWDWDCGWGVEVIPLQDSFFDVFVELTIPETNTFRVTFTPVPEPTTICLLGLGALTLIRRKK